MARRTPSADAHRIYSRDGVQLALGRHWMDGIVHVASVPDGAACACECPACGRKLIAREGTRRRHFAHARVDTDGDMAFSCDGGQMTALHQFAQRLLAESKTLTLPAVAGTVGYERLERFPTRLMTFEESTMEKAVGSIRPDVVLSSGPSTLHVEVFVTHSCPPEKIEAVRAAGHAMVEIDLSRTDRDVDLPGLKDWILHRAPRRWIHNRHIAGIEAEIVAKAEARRREEAAKQERELNNSAATLKAAYRRAASAALADDPKVDPLVRRAAVGGWQHLIHGFDALAPGLFTVHPDRWRSYIITSVLHEYYGRTADDVTDQVTRARMTNRNLTGRHLDHHIVAARAGLPTGDAVVVVEHYLRFLERSGAVREVGGLWKLDLSIRDLLRAQDAREARLEEEHAERGRRINRLQRSMDDITSAFPVFDSMAQAWCERPLWGSSPIAIAHAGGDRWTELEHGLSSILRCLHDGVPDPAPPDLGLPLVAEAMERSVVRRRERTQAAAEAEQRREAERKRELERQADDRATTIRHEALGRLFDDAEGWLASPLPHDAGLPGASARRSIHGLEIARDALEKAVERRRQRLKALEDLKAFASQHIARTDARDLMLKSTQPKLHGASMLAYCRNEVTLQACKDIIKPPTKRRR